MRVAFSVLLIMVFVSIVEAKEKTFTGSTPATSTIIRKFLGIPMTDSVDFIRWNLVLEDTRYSLRTQFGIGKPNTDGFLNGGTTIELSGELAKDGNYYVLHNRDKILMALELNADILHFVNKSKGLLVGNSGWSYSLNNTHPFRTPQANFFSTNGLVNDSISYEGRTPCGVPGVIPVATVCYKLKWYIILYADGKGSETGHYKVYGTPYRKNGGRTGRWRVIRGHDGRVTYRLDDNKG